MKGLPIDVGALITAGDKLREDRDKPVKLVVLVEVDAADELLDVLQPELTPKTAKAIVDVAALEPGVLLKVDSAVDAVIVLVGSGAGDVVDTLQDLRHRAIPTAVLSLRPDASDLTALTGYPKDDILVGEDAAELVRGPLADWVMEHVRDKRVAIAHNFAFVRRAVAKESMKATAWQNALIGGVAIIPGADMPLMTLNQSKMLLQMAAAYGQDLGAERIWELAAVTGGGFLLRSFARQFLTLIPGFGWALKAGVAYGGTIAMGEAAIAYFERGASLPEMLEGLKQQAIGVGDTARRRRLEWLESRQRKAVEAQTSQSGRYTSAAHVDDLALPGQLALPDADGGAGDE